MQRLMLLIIVLFTLAMAPPPQDARPSVSIWSSVTSIGERDLLQRSVRLPVSWATTNRPDHSTLVFEQVLPEGAINVELPRANPWVNSSGSGLVAPIMPPSGRPVVIQVRLLDLKTQRTLALAEVRFSVGRSTDWTPYNGLDCIIAPYPSSIGLEVVRAGRVRADVPTGQLKVWDRPAPEQNVVGTLPAGEAFRVVGGPFCYPYPWSSAGGTPYLRWWQVQSTQRALTGWVEEYTFNTPRSHYYNLELDPATPAPTAPPSSGPTVLNFSATPDSIERGGTVTLTWQVTGVTSVTITRMSEDGVAYIDVVGGGPLAPQGTISYQVPDYYVGQVPFTLTTDTGIWQALTVNIRCAIADPLTAECPISQTTVDAAYQPFENGLMLWRADSDTIYVLYTPTRRFETYPDTWVEGQANPVTDAPPAGYSKPERGFGWVWGSNPAVRAGLGWALAQETAYRMTVEQHSGAWNEPPRLMFTLPDGTVLVGVPYQYWNEVQ